MSRHLWLVLCLWGCGKAVPTSTRIIEGLCTISVEEWPIASPTHVPVGSTIDWDSNPPASGSHFPRWAAYQEYTSPVPRGYWVHSLEHGAVVLLSNCALAEGADCEPILAALRQASASIPSDGTCVAPVRVRTVITPDPSIQTPIVAVAWGFIYRSACVDQPSLEAFVKAHYASGPENVCANGISAF